MNFDTRVSISPQALHVMADRIDQHANNIDMSMTNARNTIESLIGSNAFVGSSAIALLWRYNNIRLESMRIASRIREYARRIRLAAAVIDTADKMQIAPSHAPMCVADTFLQNGGEWLIRRKDGQTHIYFRHPDGTEVEIPSNISSDDLVALFNNGNLGIDGLEKMVAGTSNLFDLKLQAVSESDRATAYMRHLPGWASKAQALEGVAGKLEAVGWLINGGLIAYNGYRIVVGDNGDYYQTMNVGGLNNGMEFTIDHYVERDADEVLVGNLGGIAGGVGAAALVGYLVGAPVTVPATIAAGALVIGASIFGSIGGESTSTAVYRNYFEYEPVTTAPSTDLRFTANGVEGRAAYQSIVGGGRIDLARILDGDGEVILRNDANGHLIATGGVNSAPTSTVYLSQ